MGCNMVVKYDILGGGLGEPGFPNNYKFRVNIKRRVKKKK